MKIIRIIQQLSKVEKRNFKKFLQSPYFNSRQDVILLFDFLSKYPSETALDKQLAWESFAGKTDLIPRELHLVSNYLSKLLQQFCIQEELANQPLTNAWLLVQHYKQRDLKDFYEDALLNAETTLKTQKLRNADYSQWGYQVFFEKYYGDHITDISDERPVQEMFDLLDQAWVSRKLRQICLLLNRQKIYKSALKVSYLPEVIVYVESIDLEVQSVIAAYYHAYRMLLQGGEAEYYFQCLKSVLIEHPTKFSTPELRELHLFALNYCVRQINASQKAYFREALTLYQEGLDQSTLFENGHLSRFTYHNIVAAGLQCQEFEWVENFMHSYKNTLERTYRDSTFSFNAAKLAYSKGKLQESLGWLQNANYRDLLLNLPAKALTLKIYYELEETEVLHSHIAALQAFIHRKRVMGYHKENYLNLIKHTHKLVTINRFDKIAVSVLRQQIEAEEPLTEKEWLLAQLDKL